MTKLQLLLFILLLSISISSFSQGVGSDNAFATIRWQSMTAWFPPTDIPYPVHRPNITKLYSGFRYEWQKTTCDKHGNLIGEPKVLLSSLDAGITIHRVWVTVRGVDCEGKVKESVTFLEELGPYQKIIPPHWGTHQLKNITKVVKVAFNYTEWGSIYYASVNFDTGEKIFTVNGKSIQEYEAGVLAKQKELREKELKKKENGDSEKNSTAENHTTDGHTFNDSQDEQPVPINGVGTPIGRRGNNNNRISNANSTDKPYNKPEVMALYNANVTQPKDYTNEIPDQFEVESQRLINAINSTSDEDLKLKYADQLQGLISKGVSDANASGVDRSISSNLKENNSINNFIPRTGNKINSQNPQQINSSISYGNQINNVQVNQTKQLQSNQYLHPATNQRSQDIIQKLKDDNAKRQLELEESTQKLKMDLEIINEETSAKLEEHRKNNKIDEVEGLNYSLSTAESNVHSISTKKLANEAFTKRALLSEKAFVNSGTTIATEFPNKVVELGKDEINDNSSLAYTLSKADNFVNKIDRWQIIIDGLTSNNKDVSNEVYSTLSNSIPNEIRKVNPILEINHSQEIVRNNIIILRDNSTEEEKNTLLASLNPLRYAIEFKKEEELKEKDYTNLVPVNYKNNTLAILLWMGIAAAALYGWNL